MNDFLDLDEDDVTTICQAICKPGGEITRSNHRIPNPGIPISALSEKRLKLVLFMVQHCTFQINRQITPDLVTTVSLSEMAELRSIQKGHKEPDSIPAIESYLDMTQFLGFLSDKLTLYHGCQGVPLTYLVRPNQISPNEVNDPRNGYDTIQQEMIARATYVHSTLPNRKCITYNKDNECLATILKEMTNYNNNAKTWAEQCMRNLNGRGIINASRLHYLGASTIKTQQIEAEKQMKSLTYTMKGAKFSFERYTTLHRRCHNQINTANAATKPPMPPLQERIKLNTT